MIEYGKPTKLNDAERGRLLATCQEFINHAEHSERQQNKLERAAINQDYYRGAQWTQEEWDVYKANGVEPITINRCLPTIRVLTGMYVQGSQEATVRPNRSGSEAAAKVLTELIKHAQDSGGCKALYTDLFKLGVIENESFIEVTIDPIANPNGQFVFDVYESLDVTVDPDAKYYDLNKDCRYVILRKWKDKQEIDLLYPDLHDALNKPKGYDDYLSGIINTICDDHSEYDEETGQYRYKVRTVYWTEPVKALAVTSKRLRETRILTDPAEIKKARKAAGKSKDVTIRDTIARRVHKSTMVGDLLADDVVNPFSDRIKGFPVFRFAPHFDNGYVFGVIDSIRSLNKEENINRTQTTRLLNQTVNGGWKIADGSDKQAVKALQSYGATPGLIIDESKYGGRANKIEQTRISDHFVLGEQSSNDVKEVSGLNDAVHGYETSASESGRALILKQQQGQLSTETIFANFYRTLESVGKLLLDCIQHLKVYDEDEIRNVVGNSGLLSRKHLQEAENILMSRIGGGLPAPQPVQPPGPEVLASVRPDDMPNVYGQIEAGMRGARMYAQEYPQLREAMNGAVEEYAVRLLLSELHDARLSEYSLTIASSPSSPTARLARFAEMEAIQEKYGVIPPDIFIEATDLPDKDEIVARMQQAQAQPQQQVQGAVA